jgi:hypothetical protein
MQDNFNLAGYLKKNGLLKENIGGMVDLKPLGEFEGQYQDFSASNQQGNMDSQDGDFEASFDRIMALGGEQIAEIIEYLLNDGFEKDDIKELVDDILNHL